MNQELSQRLKEVAAFVPEETIVADIGTDHAYLPIYLVEQLHVAKVIGSEVAAGPLENARRNVALAGMEKMIDLRFGNGVQTLTQDDYIDVITIAGMGGKTITSILADGLEKGILPVKRLVLQPNTDEWQVRFWLWQHGYKIQAERILTERKGTYEIIVADYVGKEEAYTRDDILFGPYLLKQRPEEWCHKYEQEAMNLKRILQKIPPKTPRHAYVANHLQEIEAMLNEYTSNTAD